MINPIGYKRINVCNQRNMYGSNQRCFFFWEESGFDIPDRSKYRRRTLVAPTLKGSRVLPVFSHVKDRLQF
jgi:hypothetical protein